MEADQLLARTLQSEEMQHQQLNRQQQEVLGILQQNQTKVQSVEDPQLQARARSLMPLDTWRQAANEQYQLNRQLEPGTMTTAADDLVVKSMLSWFKRDFFAWVNNPPCATCGSSSTQHIGMVPPSASERAHAGQVEAYQCSVCGQETRFPRYTSPAKLLESRRGRCGEWAHCFLLMLRAAGYDARHVCDNADHVWNEYWSRALGRWVHVDACEVAWDTPLLYEGGWGKTLGFVLATAWHGHADVTRRYVLPAAFPQLHTRRAGVPAAWLVSLLTQSTTRLRQRLPPQQRRALAARDATEMLQLMSLEDAPRAAAAAADLPGRQSGAEAWRQARGETGTSRPSVPAVQPPTSFTYAADTSLAPLFARAGRLTGGVCRAAGEHTGGTPSQTTQRIFDGSTATKWLDFGGGGPGGASWVEYRLLPSAEPVTVTHYDLICAEDCPERDPCDWVLEAQPCTTGGDAASSSSSSSGAGTKWVVLHQCRGHRFSRRHQLCSFVVPQEAFVPSRTWRLRVTRTADPSTATCVQLACWNMYRAEQRCVQRGLLYMDGSMCRQLQAAAVTCGAAGGEAAEAGTKCSDSETPSTAVEQPSAAGLSTLRRILSNLKQHQHESKYFRLCTTADRVKQVLADAVLQAAVLAVGFRPVMQDGAGAEPNGLLSLVADDTSADVQAAAAELLRLLGDTVATSAPA